MTGIPNKDNAPSGLATPTCSACGSEKTPVLIAGTPTGTTTCEPCDKKLRDAWEEVKQRALHALSDFEGETSVTVKLLLDDDRQWAIAKTDDDGDPVLMWNERDDAGFWHQREVWLSGEIKRALLEFCEPNNDDPSSRSD